MIELSTGFGLVRELQPVEEAGSRKIDARQEGQVTSLGSKSIERLQEDPSREYLLSRLVERLLQLASATTTTTTTTSCKVKALTIISSST
jgi:hypothetical protein